MSVRATSQHTVAMNIIEIYNLFPDEAACISHLEAVRWNGKPVCPYCGSDRTTPMPNEQRHHCNACNTTFRVTVGTIFHHTHLDLQKWFLAISLILDAKKGISTRQLAHELVLNKNTAWYLARRIRKAMELSDERNFLVGVVEVDETYVVSKSRIGRPGESSKRGRGTKKTTEVTERGGNVRANVVEIDQLNTMGRSSRVRSIVGPSKATLMTDEHRENPRMSRIVDHKKISHASWSVDGDEQRIKIEGFLAILKLGFVRRFHKVSEAYLLKYIDEFCYHRLLNDIFALTISRAVRVA